MSLYMIGEKLHNISSALIEIAHSKCNHNWGRISYYRNQETFRGGFFYQECSKCHKINVLKDEN
jgi:hypothetical protein